MTAPREKKKGQGLSTQHRLVWSLLRLPHHYDYRCVPLGNVLSTYTVDPNPICDLYCSLSSYQPALSSHQSFL